MAHTITDTARSREPVSTPRTAATGTQSKGLEVIIATKDTIIHRSPILTSTSRVNLMSLEGRLMTTCGEMNPGFIQCVICFRGRGKWSLVVETLDE